MPGQVIAYFFVPLPEPLGLPDGYVFQATSSMSWEEWLAAHDQGQHLDLDTTYLDASFRFWRATEPRNDIYSLKSLFETARKAFASSEQDLENQEASEGEGLNVERTIVEMAIPFEEPSEEEMDDVLSQAFDFGISILREFQRSYALVRKRPLTLVSRQRLPFSVLGLRRIANDEDQWPEALSVYFVSMNVHSITRDEDFTDADFQRLESALNVQSRGAVFTLYADLSREAKVALELNGEYRQAVILAATATEVALDSLLCHLMWEEVKRPEEAAALFDQSRGFISRAKSHLSPRLGGNWSLTGAGQVALWHSNLFLLRHRIMHAGYEPTSEEATAALNDGLGTLDSFIAERLSEPTAIAKYPRTAMAVLGKQGLEQRSRWNSVLEQLADDPNEPNWIEAFGRWRLTMDELRIDSVPTPADESRALLIGVIHPGGTIVWLLHDRVARKACRAVPPDPTLNQVRLVIAHLEEQNRAHPELPISIHAIDLTSTPAPGAEWVPEYRLIPMSGVMVNGQDLDPV
ncbi:MAG: hypothetical protein KY429_11690 [Actinobacteria bacterium]|nr:hypothetical protein [Actinomycetota bacterium]